MTLQRISGVAALAAAATYVYGFWIYFTLLGPAEYGRVDTPASRHVQLLIEHEALMIQWNLVIYVLNAVLMVILVAGLHQRMAAAAPVLARLAGAFGLVWAGLILAAGMVFNVGMTRIVALAEHDAAAAEALWHAVVVVGSGLGGGNEITGGLWVLLLSFAAWRTSVIPRLVGLLGSVVGAAGVVSTVPAFAAATTVFGLGFILWFVAIGFVLMAAEPKDATPDR